MTFRVYGEQVAPVTQPKRKPKSNPIPPMPKPKKRSKTK